MDTKWFFFFFFFWGTKKKPLLLASRSVWKWDSSVFLELAEVFVCYKYLDWPGEKNKEMRMQPAGQYSCAINFRGGCLNDKGFPGASAVKNSSANAGGSGSTLGRADRLQPTEDRWRRTSWDKPPPPGGMGRYSETTGVGETGKGLPVGHQAPTRGGARCSPPAVPAPG